MIIMILILLCYIFSLIVHEFAHEYYLYKFNLISNKTADITYIYDKNDIYNYINPLNKISIYSLLCLFFFKSISWTKELEINFKEYNKLKIKFAYLIGSLSNIILSIISLIFFKFINFFFYNNFINEILFLVSVINFYMGLLNLIPLPGLDAWYILKFSKKNSNIYFTYLILFLGIINIQLFSVFNFIYEILFINIL